MKEKKFNFGRILMGGASASGNQRACTASIMKNGQLVISKTAETQYGFAGRIADFVWDPQKRALGWKILPGTINSEDFSKTMKLFRKVEQHGQSAVSIGRILSSIGIGKENFTGLEICKYQDIMEKREIFYVIVPKQRNDGNKDGDGVISDKVEN